MNDYLDEFLDKDALIASSAPPARPNWVSDSNSSGAAYEAIQNLYQQKLRYICIFRDDLASDFGMSRPPISVSSGH